MTFSLKTFIESSFLLVKKLSLAFDGVVSSLRISPTTLYLSFSFSLFLPMHSIFKRNHVDTANKRFVSHDATRCNCYSFQHHNEVYNRSYRCSQTVTKYQSFSLSSFSFSPSLSLFRTE